MPSIESSTTSSSRSFKSLGSYLLHQLDQGMLGGGGNTLGYITCKWNTNNLFLSLKRIKIGIPPLSLLYILMVKELGRIPLEARIIGKLLRINITQGIKETNHTQFVDDTLLIGGASPIIARIFIEAIEKYLESSRGKVKNDKCKVYGWKTNPRMLTQTSRNLEFTIETN
jgi:hypothetical protein